MSYPSQSPVRRTQKWWSLAIAALVVLVLVLFVGGRQPDVGQGGMSMLTAGTGTQAEENLSSRVAALEERLSMLQRRCVGKYWRPMDGRRSWTRCLIITCSLSTPMSLECRFWLENLDPTFHYRSKFWLGKADNVEDKSQVRRIHEGALVTTRS